MSRNTGSGLCDQLVQLNELVELTKPIYDERTAPDPYLSNSGKFTNQCPIYLFTYL